MEDREKKTKPCPIGEKDKKAGSNLCCCFTLDEDGHYDTPCYTPVEACCEVPDVWF